MSGQARLFRHQQAVITLTDGWFKQVQAIKSGRHAYRSKDGIEIEISATVQRNVRLTGTPEEHTHHVYRDPPPTFLLPASFLVL